MRHFKKHNRTEYEFAFTDSKGDIKYTFWLVSKSVRKAQRMAIQYVEDIEKATGTKGESWNFTTFGLENKKDGYTARFTGRTLLEVRGYAK